MLSTPEPIELLTFFQSEPIESQPEDGFYVYQVADPEGITLRFSLNELEGSIQTLLNMHGQKVAQVSQEGATRLTLHEDASGNYLRCDFDQAAMANSRVEVRLKPRIMVDWSTLLNQRP